jgi:predicted ABC-type ATPase
VTPPILWVIAGANGSGKTTFWQQQLSRLITAEFVNADDLARARFGRPAESEDEAAWGQQAAACRRRELMRSRLGFVMESTFSHPSKLDLLSDARDLGYLLHVFHLHLDDPATVVERVAIRVSGGGHDVPEDRILGRFGRNPAIIRDAVLQADEAWVLDAAPEGAEPTLMLRFFLGWIVERHPSPAAWVRSLYLGQPALTPPAPD